MQASGSFELARNGRKRPTNLLTTRDSSSDLHCYSPSFNPAHSSSGHLPPTPITAGLAKEQLLHQQSAQPSLSGSQRSTITLPSINDMLSHAPASPASLLTPPSSGRMGALAPRLGDDDDDAACFAGPRPTWVQDSAASNFVGVRPPVSRQSSLEYRQSKVSPRSFNDLVQEEETSGVVGLGFGMSDATPRIGCFGSNALGLHTPTQSSYVREQHYAPSAPSLAQEGRFESVVPSSPISPPLQNWNTSLRLPASQSSAARPSSHIGQARPRPSSVSMQRELTVSIESDMPKVTGNLGLGVSLSGNMEVDITRGAAQDRVASTSALPLDAPVSPPIATAHQSTGLTPSLNAARIQDLSVATPASPSSPSLRARSKKRSDLVRREAEAAVRAGLATRDPDVTQQNEAAGEQLPKAASPSVNSSVAVSAGQVSPRKRALSERDSNTSSKPARSSRTSPTRKDNPASPWGVFRLKEEGWKPLGPPGGGKGVGISAVMKNSSTASAVKKQKRLTVSGSSRPVSRDNDHNKENDVPSAAARKPSGGLGGKRPSTAGAQFSDVFGSENHQMSAVRTGRFAHVHSGTGPSSRPSSAQGMATKKRSPPMGVR